MTSNEKFIIIKLKYKKQVNVENEANIPEDINYLKKENSLLKAKNQALGSQVENLVEKLQYADKILFLYENIANTANKELQEAYKIIDAFESVEKLSSTELMDAYATIKATEQVGELSRSELICKDKLLRSFDSRLKKKKNTVSAIK